MASKAHASYVYTKMADLKSVQEQILSLRPTLETLPALNELHGKQEQLMADITFFEDSQSLLKSQLAQLENQNSATTLEQNHEEPTY